jgi:hypothetical protein
MPFELEKSVAGKKCDVCGKIARDPIVIKTCCVNKPVTFCSKKCYQVWKAKWLKRQEQMKIKK